MSLSESENRQKKKHSPKKVPWKRIFRIAASLAAVFLLLFLCLIWRLIATAPEISPESVSPSESATYICDENGTYLRKLTFAASNRDIISLEEIPLSLQHAVIAIEDDRFYSHGGIDIRGILRAFWSGISNGSFSEGASTITQQLIKNSIFTEWTQEKSFADRFRRKIQEQYLAVKLENLISKDQILQDYLNIINFGSGCYGVQAAARRYFGKDASDLTLSESAVLAAIPQNPTGNNPIYYPEANQRRQTTVLQYMKNQGYITEEELTEALNDDVYARILTFNHSYEDEPVYSYYEDALIEAVIQALMEEKGYSREQAHSAVYSGGLRIYSAQDPGLQKICDEEFQNPSNFPEGTEYGIDYALSVEYGDGSIIHYGSEALRKFVRENLDSEFDLLCTSQQEARNYADAFRESVLSSDPTDSSDSTAPLNSADSLNSSDSNAPETASADSASESLPQNTEASSASVLQERLSLSPQPQASLVLIEQSTGYVRAIVGGRGEKTASLTLNRATETTRQPGSTFKILTAYAPALNQCGKTLASTYENEPYFYEDGTPVSNWDITDYSGTVTIREAITRSINVIAVKCITEITPALGFSYAQNLGISTLVTSADTENGIASDIIAPLALGGITRGVTNLELCNAYAAIANGGLSTNPRFFTKVLDRHGDILLDRTVSGGYLSDSDSSDPDNSRVPGGFSRVLSEETAFLLTSAMEDVVSSPQGTAWGTISAAGQKVAGKTGTTSDYKDIWFAGYTPYYTCCVWGGYDNNKELPLSSISHIYSKVLWSAVMNRIHAELPVVPFTQPSGIETALLCSDTHMLARENACPDTYTEYFARGTLPKEICTLHEELPETENITILPSTEEAESETDTEPGSETEKESISEADSETDKTEKPESEESEIQPDTVPPLPPESEETTETESSSEFTEFPESHPYSETNSFEDLLNRLNQAPQ